MSLASAGRPSFWWDEAATISASYSRSLGQLWQMLGHVDAPKGLYYLFMHAWFQIFPPTEFWSRVPSGLAIGCAAAGVVVLGRQFSTRSTGVTSGAICSILPRATWAGIEARPYAMTMMAAVWLSVLFVHASRRANSWIWLSYGVAHAVSILLNVYLGSLVLVHSAFLLAFHRTRTAFVRFGITSLLALGAVAPFVLVFMAQVDQISWLGPLRLGTLKDVAFRQYFDGCPPFAIFSTVVTVSAIVLWRCTSRRLDGGDRELLVFAVVWIAVPTVLILLVSVLADPIYHPRYLSFTAPAVALVLGVCIVALARSPWTTAALVCLFALAAAPNYVLVQRGPYKKWGMDYSQVADLIAAKAAPGDCLLVNDTVTVRPPAPIRPFIAARPDSYRKLVDVSLWQRAVDRNRLWDTNLIPEASAGRLEHCSDLWIMTQADHSRPKHERGSPLPPGPQFATTPAFAVANDLGFRLYERWQFSSMQLIRAARQHPTR